MELRDLAVSGMELRDLARKYDALDDLRERREKGGGVAERGELMALAREFPGALRELDTLSRAEIERRRASLRATLLGDPPAPWMTWMIAYHATMRAALFIKGRLARSRDRQGDRAPGLALPDELARQIAEDAARHSSLSIDDAFVHAVARPPARRVNAAVFERLGRELGIPAEEMWQELFPTRRANRF
ncbi:MAG TPA: hypothetical protein VK540_33875 [Polyangiaceae bacterium]|jgi:hypothetical protein|nr:hypothetical protein [Polyangiaceae bacterium]